MIADNSQTNSTDMRSTTATPVSLQTTPTPEPHLGNDSLPNNDQPKKQPVDSKMLEQHKDIDDEIMELRRQLPPIDFDAVNNWTDHDADIVCTCKVIEYYTPIPYPVYNTYDGNMEGDEKVLQIEVKLTDIDEQLRNLPPDLPDEMRNENSMKATTQIDAEQKPRMKSIFDLDFDDDNDPINRFKPGDDDVEAEQDESESVKLIDLTNSNSTPVSLQESQNCNTSIPAAHYEDITVSSSLPPPTIPENEVMFSHYEVREDPLCPAKAYFITSKSCITQYHVDTLHNYFIPNVNGNWSVPEPEEVKSESADIEELEELKFVPKCNHMRMDKIPKNLTDFDIGWYRQRKLRRKVEKTEAVDIQPPDSGIVDQDETEVISSRLSNSSQTNVIDHVTDSDGRYELNCDLKPSCMDDGNVEDVSRISELEAMDGQSDECIASTESRKRKASKRKSVKYKIRKSSSDFSRDLDGVGGPYDGRDPKIEAPTRIILKFSRQVTTDADMEDGDEDDDDYDESDEEDGDDEEETFDECEDDDENMDEDGSFIHGDQDKDDLVEYNDQINCHSNDNIREISNVENNNDDIDKFDRIVNHSTDVMDVDHFKLRRFSVDEPMLPMTKFDHSPTSSHQTSIFPINHLPIHSHPEPPFLSHSTELNHNDSNHGIATTPQSIEYDDDKTVEQLPLENNEQLASFNNISNENESGIRATDGLEFKEWHEVVRVRSYNDELLTILPYVVID